MTRYKKLCFMVLLACTIFCLVGVSAYAETPTSPEIAEVPEPVIPETTPVVSPDPTPTASLADALTPDGNLTLTDDVSDDANKQFLTVVSKNGNYFYIIVDRSKEGEQNVHFLNQVDEADLLALAEEGDETATEKSCICTVQCELGKVNRACAVCTQSVDQCLGTPKTPEPTESPEPEETAPQKSKTGSIVGIFIFIVVLGGGAYYYLKIWKPKHDKKGASDLDDYDFGEYDDEEDEDENNMEIEVIEDDMEIEMEEEL